jgi:chorismate mutase
MVTVRAIRGAIQIDRDDPDLMRSAVLELMSAILQENDLTPSQLISVLFTCTPDLVSDFPAASARAMGMEKVPLLCAVEMAVPGSLPRTIRTLVHCHTTLEQTEIAHIYLRGAVVLRKDIAQ